MSKLTRDGAAEPVSRDQILRRVRGQGNTHFPCLADHEQDWQPYPVDPYSAIICDDHTYIHTLCENSIQFISIQLPFLLVRVHFPEGAFLCFIPFKEKSERIYCRPSL